ncbi:MAG: TraR/DksA C4-type zinc finger protein [bacterium]
MAIDYKHYQNKLEEEKTLLEKELETVGRRNPDALSDWEAIPTDRDTSQADDNTVADSVEDYEENVAIVNTLETRYNDVLSGLDKIKNGTYGLCQECGMEISPERLEANPAARNCRVHM